jgi:hypothetical protein
VRKRRDKKMKYDSPRDGGLVSKVMQLLDEYEGSMYELSYKIKVDVIWLRRFRAGKYPAANPNRLEYVYFCLSGERTLTIDIGEYHQLSTNTESTYKEHIYRDVFSRAKRSRDREKKGL